MSTPEQIPAPEANPTSKTPQEKNSIKGKFTLTAGLIAGVLGGGPAVYLGKTAYETVPSAIMGEASDQVKEAAVEALEALSGFKALFMPFMKKFVSTVSWINTAQLAYAGGAGAMADIYSCLADDKCTPEQTFKKIMSKMEEVMPNYPELQTRWLELKDQFTVVQTTGSRALLFTKALSEGDMEAFDKTKMLDAAWGAFRDEVKSDFDDIFTSAPESEYPKP